MPDRPDGRAWSGRVPRPRPPADDTGLRQPAPDGDGALLDALGAELDFPTQRWRLIAVAYDIGIAASSVARLQRLPDRPYRDLADLAAVFRSTPPPVLSGPPPTRRSRH